MKPFVSSAEAPVISVVIVGRDGYATLRPILACLAEQTIAGRMEVVAVLPRPEGDTPPADAVSAFGAFRTVCVGPISNRGAAAAHGVRAATAPVLAFTENHCFPDPDWAERLLAAHDGDWGGVAPAIANANPETVLSWASYAAGYVAFSADTRAREVEEMPLHNTSYRRELLVPLENELGHLLADERRLMRRLREMGARFRFHPEARARHVNEATWSLVLGLSYYNGRRYGGVRGLEWSWPRRIAYALAFPLLSLPVLRQAVQDVAAVPGRPPLLPALLPALWLQSLAHALGEAVGYLGGPKEVFDFVDHEEFMIVERLGRRAPRDVRIARFVALAAPVPAKPKPDAGQAAALS